MDIKLKNITKVIDETVIFENLNLIIKQGDFLIIKGPSGSGKTTLGNIIGGIEKPSSGLLKYDPQVTNLYRTHISFIFQNYGLLDNETVFENLKMAFIGQKTNDIEEQCQEALKVMNIKCSIYDKVKILSGGEKQRVAIARVLLKDPDVIIADEPTGNLDKKNAKIVFDLLWKLNKLGKTVILITHSDMNTRDADILVLAD